jgi:hypothetical protein
MGYVVGGSDSISAYIFKTDSLARILPPVSITNSGSELICPNDSVTLSAVSGYAYHWSNGATTSSITVGPGTYWVTVLAIGSPDSATSPQITISSYPVITPTISASATELTCTTPANSYQWFLNLSAIGGATDSLYTPMVSGDYSVNIIDTNGCPGVSAQVFFTPVGIHETETQLFNVFQSNEILQITLLNAEGGVLKVLNNTGELVAMENISKGETSKAIRIEKLSSGIYFVHYDQKGTHQVKKILLNK